MNEMKVKWKIERLFNADPNKVALEIGQGKITPQEVLDRARDENSEISSSTSSNNSHKSGLWERRQNNSTCTLLPDYIWMPYISASNKVFGSGRWIPAVVSKSKKGIGKLLSEIQELDRTWTNIWWNKKTLTIEYLPFIYNMDKHRSYR